MQGHRTFTLRRPHENEKQMTSDDQRFLKMPVPLNRKLSYDCLIISLLIHFVHVRLRMQNFKICSKVFLLS